MTDLEKYLNLAMKVHGHKCPSLFYGVTLGQIIKREIKSGNKINVILLGKTKCIKDGVNAVLENSNITVKVVSDSSDCGACLKNEVGMYKMFSINPDVRGQINQWNKDLSTEDFQVRGVKYLFELKENEIICEKNISEINFNELLKASDNQA